MGYMFPKKLQAGDEVRVIAPSTSMGVIAKDQRAIAVERFKTLGLTITFGNNVEEEDVFQSSSVESRVADIHDAFKDPNVKGIITTLGGYNANQLLSYLDYDLVKENPKVFCGYSDITVLQGAFLRKAGLVTYSGPHFSTFGMKAGFDYTFEYFIRCILQEKEVELEPSLAWSDDRWFLNQEERTFHDNRGPYVIHEGEAEGTIVGGNLWTLNLLQGTEFMPSLVDSILFIEVDREVHPKTFDRDLQSLIHLPDFHKVRGLVFGRFQQASGMTRELLNTIIETKRELRHLPMIADADFGHTSPMFTFPIGGEATIKASNSDVKIIITRH